MATENVSDFFVSSGLDRNSSEDLVGLLYRIIAEASDPTIGRDFIEDAARTARAILSQIQCLPVSRLEPPPVPVLTEPALTTQAHAETLTSAQLVASNNCDSMSLSSCGCPVSVFVSDTVVRASLNTAE